MKTHRSGSGKKKGGGVASRGNTAEVLTLRRRCAKLVQEKRRLLRELEGVCTERDQLRKSLIAAVKNTMKPVRVPTWEEVQAALDNPPIEDFITRLEAQMETWGKSNGRS